MYPYRKRPRPASMFCFCFGPITFVGFRLSLQTNPTKMSKYNITNMVTISIPSYLKLISIPLLIN